MVKKNKAKNINWYLGVFIYVLLGLLIIGILIMTFFPGTLQSWKDFTKAEDDKCRPAPGYTEESWLEHMGHHPNIYKECLD